MPEAFQRLFHRDDIAAVQSLNVQAALGVVRQPERSQFSHLVRLFLERFFNHETASSSGDGKTRMVQIACAAALPGLAVAVYLWPAYHPFPGWPPGRTTVGPPPYWAQVNHHFFFVMYSFAVLGLATLFEWDLFFPDLLDVFVLGTLPIAAARVFLARLAAIAIFIAGFLFDANFLAPLILPLSTESPDPAALLFGHVSAVAAAGLFAAGLVLALQGIFLAVLGERLFRRISLLLQGTAVAAFLVLLLLFPVLSGVTPALLQSRHLLAWWFPPFWFLGIYQQELAAPAGTTIWSALAHRAEIATCLVWVIAAAAYPIALLRRVSGLVAGTTSRRRQSRILVPWRKLLELTAIRSPFERGAFHFISQTILRVPRYRIHLVLYGGAGLSLVIATILRFTAHGGHVRISFSADGMRIAIGIIAFWVIAGLRSAFVSPGNQRGGWIFHAIQGRPPIDTVAVDELKAAMHWALLCSALVTFTAIGIFQFIAPAQLRTPSSLIAQMVVGAGLCLLLTDGFFVNVTTIPFTGEAAPDQGNLAFTVMVYVTIFPLVTTLSLSSELWLEQGGVRIGIAFACIALVHLWLRKRSRTILRLYCGQLSLEEGEDEFPTKLGLRS